MANWVWNSRRVPGGIEVRIGSVLIAQISFIKNSKEVVLRISHELELHDNVSMALKRIHQLLQSPPTEGPWIASSSPSS